MTPAELREGVVFHARFFFFDQMFAAPGTDPQRGSLLELRHTSNEKVPPNWRNFPRVDLETVDQIWQAVLPLDWKGKHPPHWCAALALVCTQCAGLTAARARLGAQGWLEFEQAAGLELLERGELPKPGDWAYFKRNQHRAIVTEVDPVRRTFDSIDGNQPAIQMYKGRALSSAEGFWSLEPLLKVAP